MVQREEASTLRCQIPQVHKPFGIRGDDAGSVGTKRGLKHANAVFQRRQHELAGHGIAEPDRLVHVGRQDAAAVRTEDGMGGTVPILYQNRDRVAGCRIPNPRVIVYTAAEDITTVRAEGD
jgi:hypothetical protein